WACAQARPFHSPVHGGKSSMMSCPMQRLAVSALFLLFAISTPAQNAVPTISQPLVPEAVAPGSGQFTLTVNGTGFSGFTFVNWNGHALPTTFVSSTQLTAVVSANLVSSVGSALVTAVNPPPGGGTSLPALLPVRTSATTAVFDVNQLQGSAV